MKTLLIVITIFASGYSFAQTKKASTKSTPKPAVKQEAPIPSSASEPTTPAPKAERSTPLYQNHESTGSQTFFMPEEGKNNIDAGFEYLTTGSKDVKVSGRTVQSVTASGIIIGADYLRGLNEKNTVGVTLGYLSVSSQYSNGGSGSVKTSGLSDIFLTYRGSNTTGGKGLIYGATLGISPVKSVSGNTSKDGTATSGGMSFKPLVGFQNQMGSSILGGIISFKYKADRTIESGNRDYTYSGENEINLTAYYETPVSNFTLVPKLSITNTAEQKIGGASSFESHTDVAGSATAYIPLNDTSKLMVGYTATMYGALKLSNIEITSSLGHELSVAGRFLF